MKKWRKEKSVSEIKNGDDESENLCSYSQMTHITPPKGIIKEKNGVKERLRFLVKKLRLR